MIRFISLLPKHLQSKHSDGKVVRTVIRDAEKHLERALVFNFDDYRMSDREAFRIEAMIKTLLNRGEITRDPIREKQWLNCQIIEKLRCRPHCENGYSQRNPDLIGRYSIIENRSEIVTILFCYFVCLPFLN